MKRRGWTLIELLVCIGLMSVLLSTAGTLLVALMRIEHQTKLDLELRTELDRLAARLRNDAHLATAAICPNEQSCHLTSANGQSIRYSTSAVRLTREVHHQDMLVHTDSFRLSPGEAPSFAMHSAGEGAFDIVRLRISSDVLIEAAILGSSVVSKKGDAS